MPIMLGGAREEGFELRQTRKRLMSWSSTPAAHTIHEADPVDAILESDRIRLRSRPGQKLVVSGVMAQRLPPLIRELPEVDAFIGLDQVADAGKIFARSLMRRAGS